MWAARFRGLPGHARTRAQGQRRPVSHLEPSGSRQDRSWHLPARGRAVGYTLGALLGLGLRGALCHESRRNRLCVAGADAVCTIPAGELRLCVMNGIGREMLNPAQEGRKGSGSHDKIEGGLRVVTHLLVVLCLTFLAGRCGFSRK